ncbi:MAG: hypothetical protein GC186_03970 [Rhodobacteraceae bacterium]|nr:hypothetical protein [Paracoccaceae bacterium]
MKLHAALLATGLALAALPALAEGGPRPAEIDALIAAMTAAGCMVTDANQAAVLQAAGLTPDVAAGVVQVLEADGRAVQGEGHTLRLKTGSCS